MCSSFSNMYSAACAARAAVRLQQVMHAVHALFMNKHFLQGLAAPHTHTLTQRKSRDGLKRAARSCSALLQDNNSSMHSIGRHGT